MEETNNSLFVKAYLQQEIRNQFMARSLDKGTRAFSERFNNQIIDTWNSFSGGAVRMATTTICTILPDNQTCNELRYYDLRMITCIVEFMKRTNAIVDIVNLCVTYILQRYNHTQTLKILAKIICFIAENKGYPSTVCEKIDDKKIEEIIQNIQNPSREKELIEDLTRESIYAIVINLQKMISGYAANKATDSVASGILANIIEKQIARSVSLNTSIKMILSRSGGYISSIISTYGLVTKATGTVERLKLCNPKLYHLLYVNKLEMFFFLFDAFLPKEIYFGDYAFTTEEDAFRFFRKIIE